jgi:hypothetical protein
MNKIPNYKVNHLAIKNTVAFGMVRGLIYRINFDHTPTEKEAIRALREAASYNEKPIKMTVLRRKKQ